MTEKEAKTKWCPFARLSVLKNHIVEMGSPVLNRLWEKESGRSLQPEGSFCIGSACMAWRWGDFIEHGTRHPEGETIPVRWTAESKTHGYCGLAGQP